MREKLIELLETVPPLDAVIMGLRNGKQLISTSRVADHLIAHGVTIQKWIPVTERLPKKITNKVITLSKNGYVGFGHYENYKGRQNWYNLESDMPFTDWNYDDDDSYEVTHWMPLPEPPKGE